jgi:hypothetical protein
MKVGFGKWMKENLEFVTATDALWHSLKTS